MLMNPDLAERHRQAQLLFQFAELIYNEKQCDAALQRMANDISCDLSASYPLVLPVMESSVVFTGKLLPLLRFPLDFDYIHITRYDD